MPQATSQALYQKVLSNLFALMFVAQLVTNLVDHPDFFAKEPVGSPYASPATPSRRVDMGFVVRHSFGECAYDIKVRFTALLYPFMYKQHNGLDVGFS